MNKHTLKLIPISLVAAASLGGCIIFEDKCEEVPSMAAPTRNPYSGECESPGWDGDYECQAYAQEASAEPPQGDALPPTYAGWGACYSHCEALDEATCTATSGCQAAYETKPYAEDAVVEPEFLGCWATAPNYLSSMQACDTLYAETCTMRDDCSPLYANSWSYARESPPEPQPQRSFLSCRAEVATAGCYSDDDCGEGFDCTADTECLPPPGCGPGMDCPAVCYGTCVASEPPPLPGNCYTLNVCEEEPPACPEGTLPGIANGCWTGYCIPLSACESPACGALDEATCQSASACEPVYEGSDCTCDGSGCECTTLTYAYCVDA